MALVVIHNFQHQVAILSHHQAIGLRLYLRGQRRRIHQIGEENRQPPDLTGRTTSAEHVVGEQALGICVRTVDGQHLSSERRGACSVTAVDRRDRPIQQLVDRSAAITTVAPVAVVPAVHVNIVSPRQTSWVVSHRRSAYVANTGKTAP